MGDPTDTITMLMERWELRYAPYRDELSKAARFEFDDLRRVARRHSTALNRMADVDFERPFLLTLLLHEKLLNRELRRDQARDRNQLQAITKILEDNFGIRLPPLRGSRPVGSELDRVGQARLEDTPAEVPVPA